MRKSPSPSHTSIYETALGWHGGCYLIGMNGTATTYRQFEPNAPGAAPRSLQTTSKRGAGALETTGMPTVESITEDAGACTAPDAPIVDGFPKPPGAPAPATHPESPDPPPPHSQGCPTHALREPRSNPCLGPWRRQDTLFLLHFLPPPQHRAGRVAAFPEAVSPRPARPCPLQNGRRGGDSGMDATYPEALRSHGFAGSH